MSPFFKNEAHFLIFYLKSLDFFSGLVKYRRFSHLSCCRDKYPGKTQPKDKENIRHPVPQTKRTKEFDRIADF